MGSITENGQLAKQIFDEYMKRFAERNPYMFALKPLKPANEIGVCQCNTIFGNNPICNIFTYEFFRY